MDHKEGLTPAVPDAQLTALSNDLQISNQPHIDGISSCLTKSPIVCIPSSNNGNKSSTNYVTKTSIQGNVIPFQTTEMPSLINSDIGEDVRLLEAAKGGMTDIILHLIEEEGQQLHSQKDKVFMHTSVYIYIYIYIYIIASSF